MVILCLKQIKDFMLKFPINGSFCWGTQNFQVYYTQYCFLNSGAGVDDVLVRLSLIEQIIKDDNLMRNSFSVKDHRHFENREWVCSICSELFPICIHTHLTHSWWSKSKLEVVIRNQKIKGTFICRAVLFKWKWVFKSWLDSFSTGVWAFTQKINFFISIVFVGVCWCSFVTVFKCSNLQSYYSIFQVHEIASDIVPILCKIRRICSAD